MKQNHPLGEDFSSRRGDYVAALLGGKDFGGPIDDVCGKLVIGLPSHSNK